MKKLNPYTIDKRVQSSGEYVHHANSLFHFMNKQEYLKGTLKASVIYPRYFIEDIGYLGLKGINQERFNNVAILGVCFCDIPLSQICYKERVEYPDGCLNQDLQNDMSHTDLYGGYAIGFTKDWGEKHGIRPMHYLNTFKQAEQALSKGFNTLYQENNLPDEVADLVLDSLAFSKPVRGSMYRTVQLDTGEYYTYRISKNFYNEQEWRYIPADDICKAVSREVQSEIKPINAATGVLFNREGEQKNVFYTLSNDIAANKNTSIGLRFDHSEIAYLIVPGDWERKQIIEWIIEIYQRRKSKNKMYDLISKIHTLEEIKRDY